MASLMLTPPPGVKANYVDPETRGPILISVGSVLTGMMILAVAMRLYSKFGISKKPSWDDLTCVIAAIGAASYFAACVCSVKAGIGPHMWDVRISHLASNFSLISLYVIDVIAAPTILFAKLSFFLLYLHVFRPNLAFRYAIYFGTFIVTLFYVATTISQFVMSTPGPGQTFLTVTLSQRYWNTKITGVVQATFGIVTDTYILCLPISAVWHLQLHTAKKVGVSLIFLTGIIAIISSCLNLRYRLLLNGSSDITWDLLPNLITSISEQTVGITCSCMPAISLILRRHFPGIKSFFTSVFSRMKSITFPFKPSTVFSHTPPELPSDSNGPLDKYNHRFERVNDQENWYNIESNPRRHEKQDVELGHVKAAKAITIGREGAGSNDDRTPLKPKDSRTKLESANISSRTLEDGRAHH